MRNLLLAILSGVLLGLAFPPISVKGLAFVAYVPLLYIIASGSADWSKKKTVGLLYAAFFTFHGMANWWVSSWQEHTDPYLYYSGFALWLGHPFFLMLPFLLLVWIRKRSKPAHFVALTPFVITMFEWLHGQTDASYPWLSTGYMSLGMQFSQLAEYVGVYGLTFLILTVNALMIWCVVSRRRVMYALPVAMVVLLEVVGSLTYGLESKAMHDRVHTEQQRLRQNDGTPMSLVVGLVQPNEDPWDKWSNKNTQVRNHIHLVDSALTKGIRPDLVVWSETAIPFTIREANYGQEYQQLTIWCDTSRLALLTGFPNIHYYTKPEDVAPATARKHPLEPGVKYSVYNAAMLQQPGDPNVQIHNKSKLTPFAERIPFADDIAFAQDWFQWGVGIGSWGKGTTRIPLQVHNSGISIGPVICIESIYPEVSRDFVLHGANVLCVITNDAWYNGTSGPRQHYAIAQMRAIETRRPLMRCGNSGVTGFINELGESIHEISPMTRGICFDTVYGNTVLTSYMKYGDLLPYLSLAVTIAAVVTMTYRTYRRKHMNTTI